MTRTLRFATTVLSTALLLVLAPAVAGAQADAPEVDVVVVPTESDGSFDVTVTGSGWTGLAPGVFICPGLNGQLDAFALESAATDCDVARILLPEIADDGSFTSELTVDVPDDGLVLVAADQESGAFQVELIRADMAVDPIVDTDAADDDDTERTELPVTGSSTIVFGLLGVLLIAAGAWMTSLRDRVA